MPEDTPAPAVETKSAIQSTTMWGGYLTAASGVVAAIGPQLLKVAGFDQDTALQCTQAIVVLLNAVAGHLVTTGRAKAGIKPLA